MVLSSVSNPVTSRAPPAPLITPEKVPAAVDSDRVLAPSTTEPVLAPLRLTIDVPLAVMPWMSNLPSEVTDEFAIEPGPARLSVPPELIVVSPS